MSIYGELDPMVEHRTQFAFKGKRKHLSRVNIPNIAYPNQYNDTEIPHGSRDHVIIPDTVKITFNLDIESTDKERGVENKVGRALVKKKVLILGSTEIDTINSEKEREEKLLQGIQPANGFKAQVSAKKSRWYSISADNPGKCN